MADEKVISFEVQDECDYRKYAYTRSELIIMIFGKMGFLITFSRNISTTHTFKIINLTRPFPVNV